MRKCGIQGIHNRLGIGGGVEGVTLYFWTKAEGQEGVKGVSVCCVSGRTMAAEMRITKCEMQF